MRANLATQPSWREGRQGCRAEARGAKIDATHTTAKQSSWREDRGRGESRGARCLKTATGAPEELPCLGKDTGLAYRCVDWLMATTTVNMEPTPCSNHVPKMPTFEEARLGGPVWPRYNVAIMNILFRSSNLLLEPINLFLAPARKLGNDAHAHGFACSHESQRI